MKKKTFSFGSSSKKAKSVTSAAEATKAAAEQIRSDLPARETTLNGIVDAAAAMRRDFLVIQANLNAAKASNKVDTLKISLADTFVGSCNLSELDAPTSAATAALDALRRALRDPDATAADLNKKAEELEDAIRALERVNTRVKGDFDAAKAQVESIVASLATTPDVPVTSTPAGAMDINSALAAHDMYAAWEAAHFPQLRDAKGHEIAFHIVIGDRDIPLDIASASPEDIREAVPGYKDKGVFVPVKTGEAEMLKALIVMRKSKATNLWRTGTP